MTEMLTLSEITTIGKRAETASPEDVRVLVAELCRLRLVLMRVAGAVHTPDEAAVRALESVCRYARESLVGTHGPDGEFQEEAS